MLRKYVKIPMEIIDQIFSQIINHQCEQGHKWCFDINTGHRYNRNKISFLTNMDENRLSVYLGKDRT